MSDGKIRDLERSAALGGEVERRALHQARVQIGDVYPIVLVRDIEEARAWLSEEFYFGAMGWDAKTRYSPSVINEVIRQLWRMSCISMAVPERLFREAYRPPPVISPPHAMIKITEIM